MLPLFSNDILTFSSVDPSLVFVVAIGAVAVYLAARWASGHRNGSDTDALQTKPETNLVDLQQTAKESGYVEPPFGEDKIVIRKFYFDTFDTVPGPPDPLNFCDELTLEVYARDTGGTWVESYTIATPGGIRAHMERHGWDVFFSQQVFVFHAYDLELIRRTIHDHVSDTLLQTDDDQRSLKASSPPAVD